VLQHSRTPSLRVAGFEDEDEAPSECSHPEPQKDLASSLCVLCVFVVKLMGLDYKARLVMGSRTDQAELVERLAKEFI
jgi:hypothetical protein